MLIVDAQIHLWNAGNPSSPTHRQVPAYTKDDALKEMDAAGVDAAVLHPPSWDPNANELAIEAARQHPDRFAILGFFPLDKSGEPCPGRYAGSSARGCSGCASRSCDGRGELARRTARWTGCGRRRSAPACRSP